MDILLERDKIGESLMKNQDEITGFVFESERENTAWIGCD